MIYIFIGLAVILVLFLLLFIFCALKVSSECSRIEEMEMMKNGRNIL